MLGTDLVRSAPSGVRVVATDREELDLCDRASVARALDAERPEWVVNVAAYTAVDRAESEREAAFAINGAAVGALGEECARRGVRVLHVSTDYVFPGDAARPYREDDPVAPLNAYGESKLAGERALEASGAEAVVVRTQWLFGAHGKSFPRTMWERALARQATRVVADQRGRPTYTVDLAAAMWGLIERDARGVFHAANDGEATWHELAARVFAAAGARELLAECTTADYPTPARRPSYSVLATGKLERALGTPMPRWEDAVDRFVAELRQG